MELNNLKFANWYRNFPEWWRQDAFLDAIGAILGELSFYYAYLLLTTKLEQPVQVWLDAQRNEEDYVLTKNININNANEDERKLPYYFLTPAPLYKTKGTIELIFNCEKSIQNLKIMINETDGLQIPFSIKSGTLLIDLTEGKNYFNDEEVSLTTIGEGITYFKTSRYQKEMTGNGPVHNECVRLTLLSDNQDDNVNIIMTVTLTKPVFHVEQNIKLSSIALLPISEVRMYVYYETPFNEELNGWRYVFKKEYPKDKITVYDRLTKHFYAKKFYVEVGFRGLDFGLTVGFPQRYDLEDTRDIFYINTNLDKWGDTYALPRRYYKDGVNDIIDEDDYPNTLPPYYPYDVEQDYWYERRLMNEYVWNPNAVNNVFVRDSEDNNVIFLESIDPYVEDLVIETGSKLPTVDDTREIKGIMPVNVFQQSTASANKQVKFEEIENLLSEDNNYTSVSLSKLYNKSIGLEKYRSFLVDIMYDLSSLPENIFIKGFEFCIDNESSNNSVSKINDIRTAILLNNVVKEESNVLAGIFRPKCEYCIYEDDYKGYKQYAKTWVNQCPHCGKTGTLRRDNADNKNLQDTGALVCDHCGAIYCGFCGTMTNLEDYGKTDKDIVYKLKNGINLSYYQPITTSGYYEQTRDKIIYGGPTDTFGLTDIVNNGYKDIDLRDYLHDYGMHFMFGITNLDEQQDCIINIYNAKLNIYYEYKETDLILSASLKYNKDSSADLDITLSNIGEITINDDIYVATSSLLNLDNTSKSRIYIPVDSLTPNSSYQKTIHIAPSNTISDGIYDILVSCQDMQRHVRYKHNSDGLIETKLIIYPAYTVNNNGVKSIPKLYAYISAEDGSVISYNEHTDSSIGNKVKFYVDDYLLKDNNGNYTFNVDKNVSTAQDIPIQSNLAGVYKLEAQYSGNSKYAPCNGISDILISKENTILTIDKTYTYKQDSSMSFTASIKTDKNIPVNEGMVTFYICDKENNCNEEIGHTYVSNGKATLETSEINKPIGTYNIYVEYKGTIAYGRSSGKTELTLIGGDVNLTVFDYDVLTGDTIFLATKVLDSINRNVTQGYIKFFILDDKGSVVDTPSQSMIEVNKQGIASMQYTVPEKLMGRYDIEAKKYTIKAQYLDINNIFNSNEDTGILKVDRLYTYIVPYDLYATQGQTIGFLVRVMNSNSIPATEGEVTVTINNKEYGTATVDEYGYAKIFYNTLSLTYEEWVELNKFSFTQEDPDFGTKEYDANGALITDNLIQIYDGSANELNTILMTDKRSFSVEDGKLYVTLPSGDSAKVFSIENGNLYIQKETLSQSDLIGDYIYDINYSSEHRYKCSKASSTLSMLPQTNSIELLQYIQDYNDTTNLVAGIDYDASSTLPTNGYINFYIDEKQIGGNCTLEEKDLDSRDGTTYKQFVATLPNHLVSEIPNTYIIKAQYVDNSNNVLFNTYNKYIVNKVMPKITLSIDRVLSNKVSKLTVGFSFINPLTAIKPAGKISIMLHQYTNSTLTTWDKGIEIDTIDVEEVGYNNIYFTIPENVSENKFFLTAEYEGNEYIADTYYENAGDNKFALNLAQVKTIINLPEKQVALGNKTHIPITLSPEDNDIINEGTIKLYISTDYSSYANDIFIGEKNVVNNEVIFDYTVPADLYIKDKQYILKAKYNGINYVATDVAKNIKIIEGLEEIYVSNKNGDDINNDGSEGKPFATISNALSCLKNKGTIYIKNGVYETEDINFNKDVTIIGENDVIIKGKNKQEITFNVLEGFDVRLKSLYFDQIDMKYYFIISGDKLGQNKGALTFNECLLDKMVTIHNLNGFLTINKSAILGTIEATTGTNDLNNNWWGTNTPDTSLNLDNWVTAKLSTSLNTYPTVGDTFDINVDFVNANSEDIYIPRRVSFTSPYGEFSIYSGMIVNNHISTEYSNTTSTCEVNAIVDNEVLKLSIEDYIKNIEIKLQNIETPIGYNTPIKAMVINTANKLIDYGRVEFYLDSNLIRNINVVDGIAQFQLFIDSRFNLNQIYQITAKYYDDKDRYNSSTVSNLKVIEDKDICFVDTVKISGDGSFRKPFNSVKLALKSDNKIIYIKSGIYNEKDWLIDKDVTIKAYDDPVVFNKGSKIFSTGINKNIIIEGIEFSDYDSTNSIDKSLIYNNGNLTLKEVIIDNNKAQDNIIQNDGVLNIVNSAIVKNTGYVLNNEGTATLDYNWWGVNNPDFSLLLKNGTVKYWITMTFNSSISPIKINDVTLLTAALSKYTDGSKIYDLENTNIPSRKGIFKIDSYKDYVDVFKYGSLTPLIDYTDLNNEAKSLYNSIELPNSLKVYLTLNKNTNYYNDNKLVLSCNVLDGYNENVTRGEVEFVIDGDVAGSVNVNNGLATLTISNNLNLSLGAHNIECIFSDTILSPASIKGTFNIQLLPIIIQNEDIIPSIYDLTYKANAVDNNGNIISDEQIFFYIDDEEITSTSDDSSDYIIKDGVINYTLSYNKKIAGTHKLTIKVNPKNTYDKLDYTTVFNIPLSPTHIRYKDTLLSEIFVPINSTDNIFKITDEKGMLVNDGYINVYKDDIKLNDNTIKITDGMVNIDGVTSNKGSYTIIFVYDTDGKYYASNITAFTLNVGVYNVDINIDNINCQYLDNVSIKGNIYDKDGEKVSKGLLDIYKVDINNNNEELIAENLQCIDGNFNYNYNVLLNAGIYHLKLIYKNIEGSNDYAITSKVISITVYPRDVSFNKNNVINTISNTLLSDEQFDITTTKGVLNEGVVIASIKNGDKYEQISVSNLGVNNVVNNIATLNLQIPVLEVGTYLIRLEYINNNHYGKSNGTSISDNVYEDIKLNITPNYTNIELQHIRYEKLTNSVDDTVYYPITTTFEAIVKDSQKIPVNVTTGKITIFENGKQTQEKILTNGMCRFDITPTILGNIELIAKYSDDTGLYSQSSITKDILVSPLPVDISVTDISAYNGDIINIPYTIDSNYDIKSNGELDVVINGQVLTTSYISNGAGTISFEAPLLPIKNNQDTSYPLSLVLKKSKLYADNIYNEQYIVKPKIIDIIMNDITASISDTILINPTFDRNITGIIYIYINNNFIGLQKIDNADSIEYKYILPDNIDLANNIITIKFSGNEYYKESSENFNLNIDKKTKNITLENISANVGGIITFNSTTDLPDGKRVDFYIGDSAVSEGIVKDGKVSGTYTLPYEYKKNEYIIKAVFNGSAVLSAIQNTAVLNLSVVDILSVETSGLECYKAGNLSLLSKITDKNNHAVTSGFIVYMINDNTLGTVPAGTEFNTTLPNTLLDDSYTLTIKYTTEDSDASNLYNNYNTTDTLILNKNPFKITTNAIIGNIGDDISFNNITIQHPTTQEPINGNIEYQILNGTEILDSFTTTVSNNIFSLDFIIPTNLVPNTYSTRFSLSSDIFEAITGSNNLIIKSIDTVYVDNTTTTSKLYGTVDNPFNNISDGIKSVSNNGIINIKGAYNTPLTIDKNITMNGTDCVISGDNNAPIITNNAIVSLNNITLKDNKTTNLSSGIVNNSNINVQNCTFENLNSKFGGAIYSNNIINVQNCTIKNNVGISGGAIYLGRQSVTSLISDNIFSNNTAQDGGAIYSYNANNIVIENNTFDTNICSNNGGAIYVSGNGNIVKNIFKSNSTTASTRNGGAIALTDGSINVEYNIFTNNTYHDGDNIIYNGIGDFNLSNNYFGSNLIKSEIMLLINGSVNLTNWVKCSYSINPNPMIINNDNEINIIFNSYDGTSTSSLVKSLPDYNIDTNCTNGTITPTINKISNNNCSIIYNTTDVINLSIKVGNEEIKFGE